jgi:hypothetical protein
MTGKSSWTDLAKALTGRNDAKLKSDGPVGLKVFEAPGLEPVFPEKRQAIDYAETRADIQYSGSKSFKLARSKRKSAWLEHARSLASRFWPLL